MYLRRSHEFEKSRLPRYFLENENVFKTSQWLQKLQYSEHIQESGFGILYIELHETCNTQQTFLLIINSRIQNVNTGTFSRENIVPSAHFIVFCSMFHWIFSFFILTLEVLVELSCRSQWKMWSVERNVFVSHPQPKTRTYAIMRKCIFISRSNPLLTVDEK